MMIKQEYREMVKSFAQNDLGCNCPEEVFSSIVTRVKKSASLPDLYIREFVIGNRLQINIISLPPDHMIEKLLDILVMEGKTERDKNSYNRFRLVFLTDGETIEGNRARVYFDRMQISDDRVHLHFFRKSAFSQTLLMPDN